LERAVGGADGDDAEGDMSLMDPASYVPSGYESEADPTKTSWSVLHHEPEPFALPNEIPSVVPDIEHTTDFDTGNLYATTDANRTNHGNLVEDAGLYNVNPSDHVVRGDDGSLIVTNSHGDPTFWHGPTAYDDNGVLKPLAVQKAEAVEWGIQRVGAEMNTLGPDGQEANRGYLMLGGTKNARLFGAYHDDMSTEPYYNHVTAQAPDHYEFWRKASAIAGYGATMAADGLASLGLVDERRPAEFGALVAAGVYRVAGYPVTAIDPTIRAAAWGDSRFATALLGNLPTAL
jgi:hypothetical protein